MGMQLDKKESRQAEYLKRSRQARFYARILMPITLVALSTGIWSDPVWGPKLAEGVEEMKPILANYLQETPFADVIGPPKVGEPAEEPVGQAGTLIEASLSKSLRPAPRP